MSAVSMDTERLQHILGSVRSGDLSVHDAMRELRSLPFEDLGFAKPDHHRSLRTGFPEVIYCPGKSAEQVVAIADRLTRGCRKVLASRAGPEIADAVQAAFPTAIFHSEAKLLAIPGARRTGAATEEDPRAATTAGTVLVISAGTADQPVAEEAAVTASEMGSRSERLYDVGVAGIHRLLEHRDRLFSANVLVVVAGMDGALPSVVGGLVSRPVIAVPTSVGYGASFEGLAALLTMLNACAAGIAVVNIDNGFGAGYLAHLINTRPDQE